MATLNSKDLKRQERAKKMLPEIAALIARRATTSDEKREPLAIQLVEEIKRQYPSEIPPTVETIAKRISEARNQEENPLDRLWHMGILDDPVLPAESIPVILNAQRALWKNGWPGVSIRQAKWIGRLHRIPALRDIDALLQVSRTYAMYERSWELAKLPPPCDTSKLDRSIIDGTWKDIITDWDRGFDFDTLSRAFEDTTKVKYGGLSIPVCFVVSDGDKIFMPLKTNKGEGMFVELPYSGGMNAFVEGHKKNKTLKSVKKQPDGSVLIEFKKSIPFLFESREFNKRLQDIIAGGSK